MNVLRLLLKIVVCTAVGAGARKLQLVAGNCAAGCRNVFQYRSGQYHRVQIQYLTAAGADKVCVGFGGTVKVLQSVDDADGLDGSLFAEHGDVAVDGAKAQIRDLRLQLLVDPFGAGVALGPTDAVEDCVSFSAVFSCSFHVSLQINNSS